MTLRSLLQQTLGTKLMKKIWCLYICCKAGHVCTFEVCKICKDIYDLCTCLVKIISIWYSPKKQRRPKKILRLYNMCFKFIILSKTIISSLRRCLLENTMAPIFIAWQFMLQKRTYKYACVCLFQNGRKCHFGDLLSMSLNTAIRQSKKLW